MEILLWGRGVISVSRSHFTKIEVSVGDTILSHCGLETTEILFNIGSDNGLLPDCTKPLPETVLIYHK